MDLRAVIFVPALVGSIIFGFVFALFAANHYLTVLQTTGSGSKQVVWGGEPVLDGFWKVFYLAWLIVLWLGPAYFIGRAVAGPTGATWLKLAVPLAVFWVCYPVSQLSSLSGPTIWLPLHPGVFARLAQRPDTVFGFMALSGATLAVLGLGFHWAFFADGWIPWLFVGSAVFVTAGLVYGRLLGRLAFALAFTKPFLTRKKKKKPKAGDGSDGVTRPPTEATEDEAEPVFRQPSDLPPIDSPDEGPLTGYDVKFEDEPRPRDGGRAKPRTRVVAEAVDDEEAPTAPPPKARRQADDEDDAPYDVHQPEVQAEERAPEQVVKPREDEMKLLRRDDTPKPLKRVWTAHVFAFLAQPDTFVVIGTLTVMCVLAGGMVRIARAFNPVSDG